MDTAFLKSPNGKDVKEVAATAKELTPYLAAGWHQVPAPAVVDQKPVVPAGEAS